MRTAIVHAGATVIGFIAGLNSLYWAGGELRPDEIERSFAYYEQNRERINVVCIGSSRIGRNINPTVFDATMQEHGVETLTINFWAGNMTGPEARFIAEHLVSHDDPPDLLIIESLAADGRIFPDDLTDRTLWWRNIRHTFSAMGDAIAADATKLLSRHIKLAAIRGFRLGKGPEIVRNFVAPVDPPPLEGMGHIPLERSTNPDGHLQLVIIPGRVETLPDRKAPPKFLRAHKRFNEQIQEIAGERTDVIVIAPPGSPLPPRSTEDIPGLLPMNDPAIVEELYVVEKWVDRSHLNTQGAIEHSKTLAHQIAARQCLEPSSR